MPASGYERRPAPDTEGVPSRHELCHRERDHVEVGIVGGVDDDIAPIPGRRQQLCHPAGTTDPDVVQRKRHDSVASHPAAGLLLDVLAQVRGPVAEGGVAAELGLSHWHGRPTDRGPVHVGRREAAGLEVCRRDEESVVAASTAAAVCRVESGELGGDMPPQGGVSPAHDRQRSF